MAGNGSLNAFPTAALSCRASPHPTQSINTYANPCGCLGYTTSHKLGITERFYPGDSVLNLGRCAKGGGEHK